MAKRGNRRGRRLLQPPSQQQNQLQHQHTGHQHSHPFHHSNFIPARHSEPTVVVSKQRRRSLMTDLAECGLPAEPTAVSQTIQAMRDYRCHFCEVSAEFAMLSKCYHCSKYFCIHCSKLCQDCWEDICFDCAHSHQGFCRGYPEKEHQTRDAIDDAPVNEKDLDWHGVII